MIKLTLPFPDAKLNPNNSKGTHWASTAKTRQAARIEAFALTLKAAGRGHRLTGDIPLSIVFVQPDKRHRDRDNLLAALKPSLDGVADALKINDANFEPVTISRAYGAKPGEVRITIGMPE